MLGVIAEIPEIVSGPESDGLYPSYDLLLKLLKLSADFMEIKF
jgi:hypothetical protein